MFIIMRDVVKGVRNEADAQEPGSEKMGGDSDYPHP